MNIRKATVKDVEAIHSLISYYAELDKMLFRSHADIYEKLQNFAVAESDSEVVGCCVLQVIWADLAEIKSLAVKKSYFGQGIGKSLVQRSIDQAMELAVDKVFVLTLEPAFFEKIGFTRIEKELLPMKVWSDCAKCSKQDHCDETALIYSI
ncbi:MAG: N-acetyltransferase [Sedimentisphaerales bacterium]|nr:N-acetyltransferase [Sedimentisphaerales bacterium]